jgi:hypothetical protein
MNRKIIGIFALVLIISSILKLVKIYWDFIDAYEWLGTQIMSWVAPNLFTMPDLPAGTKTLTIYMPLLFTIMLALGIYQLIKTRKHTQRHTGTYKS